MNTENNQHIDELIGNVLEDNVPADVDRRLRWQLENFRRQLGERDQPPVHRSMRLGRRVWFGVSAAAAAMIVVAAVIGWSLSPGVSLADVAAAVLKQPWIHVRRRTRAGRRTTSGIRRSKTSRRGVTRTGSSIATIDCAFTMRMTFMGKSCIACRRRRGAAWSIMRR